MQQSANIVYFMRLIRQEYPNSDRDLNNPMLFWSKFTGKDPFSVFHLLDYYQNEESYKDAAATI